MKLYSALSVLSIGLGLAGFAATQQGCGSESETPSTSTSSAGRVPASKPDAPAASGTDSRTFAVDALYLGETDRAGTPSATAWKDYGFDLDGKITTKESKDVCTRVAGASASNQEDGKEGIDNAFGSVILPLIKPFVATPSKTISDSIKTKGDFTILLTVKGLTDEATQSNVGLSGELLVGGKFGENKVPTFTQADDWPYRANPRVAIADAFINKGTFVNGTGGATVQLSIFIQGIALDLTINRAIIQFEHKPPSDIANGTISGVINTESFITGLEKVAGNIAESLCGGSTLDTIKDTIRKASDIMSDGSNRSGVNCDAISVGLGFTGKRIGPAKTVAPEPPPGPDPCAKDGGT